jgi:hypothetical protein
MTKRRRPPCMIAAYRVTATAVVTSWAAVLTAIQSSKPRRRGSVMAVTMARIASTTASSVSVKPRRMGPIGGGTASRVASEPCGERQENARFAA